MDKTHGQICQGSRKKPGKDQFKRASSPADVSGGYLPKAVTDKETGNHKTGRSGAYFFPAYYIDHAGDVTQAAQIRSEINQPEQVKKGILLSRAKIRKFLEKAWHPYNDTTAS
jgi:hypothetical protein